MFLIPGKQFPAHKSVLAAASPYFEAMFTGNFKESSDNPVLLGSVSLVGLRVILDVIYTGKLDLTTDNVQCVLPAAHLFQMTEIVEQGGNFMAHNVDQKNCLTFLELAEKYELEKCIRSADHYLLDNFIEISENPNFVELSKESMCRYLSDDELMINGNELEVFKCAKIWLERNQNKVDNVYDIIKHVRFPRMSVGTLMDEILPDPMIERNTQCRSKVLEALRYHTNVHTQPLQEGPQFKARGELGLLLITPARRTDNLLWTVEDRATELWLASFPDMQKVRSSHIDTPFVLESLCSVQYANFLFLFGVDNRSFSTVSWRYDASRHQWTSLASVPREAVVGCAASVLEKQIVLIGGMTINKKSPFRIISSNLEKVAIMYSIEENSWKQIVDLPEAVAYLGCTSLNGTAYSAGGIMPDSSHSVPNEGHNSNFLNRYDVSSNTWKRLTSMWNDRSHFCFESHGNMLYAIGGLQVNMTIFLQNIHYMHFTELFMPRD